MRHRRWLTSGNDAIDRLLVVSVQGYCRVAETRRTPLTVVRNRPGETWGAMYSTGDDLEPQPDARVVPLHSVHTGPDGPLRGEEQDAWRSFVEGTQALLMFLDRELVADVDLGLGEYMILEVLARHSMLRMTDLADGGLASRSTISRQVSRLVEIGDVERVPDTSDARNRLVRITDSGREHLRRAATGHADRVRRHLFAHVDPRPGHIGDLDTFFRDIREGLE